MEVPTMGSGNKGGCRGRPASAGDRCQSAGDDSALRASEPTAHPSSVPLPATLDGDEQHGVVRHGDRDSRCSRGLQFSI